jgi:phage shock protein A
MSDKDNDNKDFLDRLAADTQGKRDTDLGGMDRETAAEYVLAFVTTLKETERARVQAEQEKALWQGRVGLARTKNEELLATQAEMKVNEIDAQLSQLKTEETELRRKVDFMKDELQRLRSKPELSLDPEALLAQLEAVTGQPDTVSKKIKDTEADLELEKLKKRIQEEGK